MLRTRGSRSSAATALQAFALQAKGSFSPRNVSHQLLGPGEAVTAHPVGSAAAGRRRIDDSGMLPSRVKGPGEYDAPLLRSSHPDRLLCNRENCITGSQKMYAGGPYVPARVRCTAPLPPHAC